MCAMDVNTVDTKRQTARELADDIDGKAGYLRSLIGMLMDQSSNINSEDKEVRIETMGDMATLLMCAHRFVEDIKATCAAAMKGGAK